MVILGRRDFSAVWLFLPASVYGWHLKLSDRQGRDLPKAKK
jgi:hypothetical protein